MLLTDSRSRARVEDGVLVPLDEQDRTLWDAAMIDEGHRLVRACLALNRPGSLPGAGGDQRRAHRRARRLDDRLVAGARRSSTSCWRSAPSPVVALNRAVAVAEIDGPEVALALVEPLALASVPRVARDPRRPAPPTGAVRRGANRLRRGDRAGRQRGRTGVPAQVGATGCRARPSPGLPSRSAMHVVRYSSVGVIRLGSGSSCEPPARVVHHPDDDPVAGAALVEPGVVDEGVEPRPRTPLRTSPCQLLEPVPQHRRQLVVRVPAHRLGVDRQPRLPGPRPSRSRSAGRRGSACPVLAGSVTKSRDSEMACSTRRRGSGALRGSCASSSAQRSTYDVSGRSWGSAGTWSCEYRPATTSHASRSHTSSSRSGCSRSSSIAARCGSARSSRDRSAAAPVLQGEVLVLATPRRGSPPSAPPSGPSAVRTGTTRATKPCIIQPSLLSSHSSSSPVTSAGSRSTQSAQSGPAAGHPEDAVGQVAATQKSTRQVARPAPRKPGQVAMSWARQSKCVLGHLPGDPHLLHPAVEVREVGREHVVAVPRTPASSSSRDLLQAHPGGLAAQDDRDPADVVAGVPPPARADPARERADRPSPSAAARWSGGRTALQPRPTDQRVDFMST